jgi:hypothetical protein
LFMENDIALKNSGRATGARIETTRGRGKGIYGRHRAGLPWRSRAPPRRISGTTPAAAHAGGAWGLYGADLL